MNKYKCSGICQKPLFYFTQSVFRGPPTDACLLPLIKDISGSMENLGAAILATGVLFFIMVFISLPICCYKKNEKIAFENDESKFNTTDKQMNYLDDSRMPAQTGTSDLTTHNMIWHSTQIDVKFPKKIANILYLNLI